ncbi:TetR/AcrR family transcriptional regulator [Lacticaseibacillus baoqingensis]|uniref:TetR/AcrR family transcriptional regulator n=1 Tax=Lacticaseibacillus baoqingensis TaxID=2486013 RepID=A0ABW4E8Q9_9LACO|nr:TetR/AcrR family transcriptional regulator [Lacticaseibacillus baoqingensis]
MTTEEKVKQAFLRLMRQSAYTDITVTALAKQAGIDRRTFYRHFASVASVLAAFEGDLVKTFCQVLAGKPFAAGRVIAAINQNITHYYDFFDARVLQSS